MKKCLRCLIILIAFMIIWLPMYAAGDNGTAYAEDDYGLSDPGLIPPSEEVMVGDIEIEMGQGESVVPLHGSKMDDKGYLDTLYNYTVKDDIPVSVLAIKNCYNTETQIPDETFIEYNRYTTELQVWVSQTVGNTTYEISPDTTLTIDGNVFTQTRDPYIVDFGNGAQWACSFKCKTIRPRYIRVADKILTCSNKDNLTGPYDVFGDGTVLYEMSDNVLTLNNATLQFSEEIASMSAANDDLDTRPSFIMGMGGDLNIELVGQNKFVPAGKAVTDKSMIAGIRQTVNVDDTFSTNITGDGELSMSFDGGDTSAVAAPIGFDVNNFFIRDKAKLSLDFNNCYTFYAIQALSGTDSGVLDNAELHITDDGKCEGSDAGGISHGWGTFTLGGNSKTIIDISGNNAIWCDDDLKIADKAALLLKANGSALAIDGNISFADHEKTALVNTQASEEGRSVWDGESDLSGTYKYIRMPGLTHYEAVPASSDKTGNIEYYYDEWTDKYYSDAAGNSEITQADTIIEPTGGGGSDDPSGGGEGGGSADPCEAGHTFGAWATTKAASEITAGSQSRKCSVCGTTETRSIAQLAPTLPAVKISKPKAARKAATVKWKKISKKNLKKVKKVQIQYSTDKTFKKGVKTKYASAKKTSYKIKSLKSKKTYYVRIRAYTKNSTGVHVSKWSSVKKVKAK